MSEYGKLLSCAEGVAKTFGNYTTIASIFTAGALMPAPLPVNVAGAFFAASMLGCGCAEEIHKDYGDSPEEALPYTTSALVVVFTGLLALHSLATRYLAGTHGPMPVIPTETNPAALH